ncbi:hypothetical protein ABZS76_33425 [Streptomyces sp. NPDC005562]|uniref:hypothetical protein n=1 Tax=Streptomyces sp. NPDC005562 TaxID=3154890 RepID=UPI0033AF2756
MNLNDSWNYILASLDVVGLIALRAVGQKKAHGWLWAMFTQVIWVVYSISTLQWGFLAVALVKFGIYAWNWASWVRSDKAEAAAQREEQSLDDLARQLIERACPSFSIIQREQYTQTFVKLALTAAAHEARQEPATT